MRMAGVTTTRRALAGEVGERAGDEGFACDGPHLFPHLSSVNVQHLGTPRDGKLLQ